MADAPTTEVPSLVDEEAQLEAELGQLEAAEKQRAADRAPAERKAKLKLAIESKKAIAKAEAEFGQIGAGEIAAVETGIGIVILRRPKGNAFRKFMDSPKATAAEFETMVTPCVVHPDLVEWRRIMEARPAALTLCADVVATLAGAKGKAVLGG